MDLSDHVGEVEPSVLIAVGFVFFIIPEPTTPTLGVGMMLLGIVWWPDE